MPGRLFEPFQMGPLALSNRLAMAPMTRSRATVDDVPTALMADYYGQRAGAGLILTEATHVSPRGKGYQLTPGIYNAAQVAGWRRVTDRVHANGGRIFLQLYHAGRISLSRLQPGGAAPVAPSALRAEAKSHDGTDYVDVDAPRALATAEVAAVVEEFRAATRNALAAGFDGVQLHGANAYLIQQFLRDSSNRRDDRYGGGVENRARFLFEVLDAVTAEAGAPRVALRLSPLSVSAATTDSDPLALYGHVIERLNAYDLAFLELVEGTTAGPHSGFAALAPYRSRWRGRYMANNGYDAALAEQALASGHADLVSFGRLYLPNPDLEVRLGRGGPFNEIRAMSAYGGGEEGYADYPALAAE